MAPAERTQRATEAHQLEILRRRLKAHNLQRTESNVQVIKRGPDSYELQCRGQAITGTLGKLIELVTGLGDMRDTLFSKAKSSGYKLETRSGRNI